MPAFIPAQASRLHRLVSHMSARRLGATSLRSCARLLRNLRGFPPKASLSSAHPAQPLAPGGPRPIAAAVVGCNGRDGSRPLRVVATHREATKPKRKRGRARPSPCFESAERAAVRRREAERASDGGARQTPTGWMRTRREVFRPSAPRHPRRMDDASYAGCANGSRESRTSRPRRSSALTELAGRAMPPPLAEPA